MPDSPAEPEPDAERLWELHDRGFIDDVQYAAAIATLG